MLYIFVHRLFLSANLEQVYYSTEISPSIFRILPGCVHKPNEVTIDKTRHLALVQTVLRYRDEKLEIGV